MCLSESLTVSNEFFNLLIKEIKVTLLKYHVSIKMFEIID